MRGHVHGKLHSLCTPKDLPISTQRKNMWQSKDEEFNPVLKSNWSNIPYSIFAPLTWYLVDGALQKTEKK